MSRDLGHLAGRRFPGGEYTLPDYVSWLWTDCVAAKPDRAVAHPGIAYMVGLHGGGWSIQEIMDLLETSADAGVMFGEVKLELTRPLRPGSTYRVDGEVLAVERKQGRRSGPFDVATFVHRLIERNDRDLVAAVTHTWIVPRSESG